MYRKFEKAEAGARPREDQESGRRPQWGTFAEGGRRGFDVRAERGERGSRGPRGPRGGFGPGGFGPGGFGPGEFGPGGFGRGGPRGFGRGGFGPGGGPWRGSPGRGRRGDVRAACLALLAEEPRNGYQLIQEIAERSDHLWRPSPGSVYPALAQLEDEGLIRPTSAEGQKLFELTDAGRNYVTEHADELRAPWEAVAEPHADLRDVRAQLHQLGMAMHQVVVAGDRDQIARAGEIVDDARRALYRILAGDEPSSAQEPGPESTKDA